MLNEVEKANYEKIVAMLPFQAVWALDYNFEKRKYKLEKNRREKERVKERLKNFG